MEHKLNYDHGFTKRQGLDTDTDKVAKIMLEHIKLEKRENDLNSLIDYSLDLESKLRNNNRHDNLKESKLYLLDTLVKKQLTEQEAMANAYESDVRARLSRYKGNTRNVLSGWLKTVRIEIDKRRNNVL